MMVFAWTVLLARQLVFQVLEEDTAPIWMRILQIAAIARIFVQQASALNLSAVPMVSLDVTMGALTSLPTQATAMPAVTSALTDRA